MARFACSDSVSELISVGRVQSRMESELESKPGAVVGVAVVTIMPPFQQNVSQQPKEPPKLKSKWRRLVGILLPLLTSLCYSLIFAVVKLVPHVHPVTQTIWRQALNILISVGVALVLKCLQCARFKYLCCSGQQQQAVFNGILGPGLKVDWMALGKIMGSGCILSCTMLLRVMALEYLTIGDATIANYLSLAFTLILATLILGEKCRLVPSSMALLIVCGALLIIRPPFLTGGTNFDSQLAIGVGMKVGDGLFTALFCVILAKFRPYHFAAVVILTNLSAICITIGVTFAFDLFTWPEGLQDTGLLILLGTLTATAHISLILALKFENLCHVALIRCADVPFAFMWQILIFQIMPDEWSIIGTLLVCTGVVVTSVSKIVAELPPASAVKKRLNFLLS